jgi:RNA polymerase sigma factor (sigma-70 family)
MADFPITRASLLVRLRDPRDDTAWSDFVHLYSPLVYGYARKQGLQEADAADLCQEVLGTVVGAIRRLEYDPRRGAFRNWLFTLVRRRLSDWRAAPANRALGSGDTAVQQLLEESPAPGGMEVDWQTQWEERLVLWACEEARRHVTDSTWQAFWRTAIDGQRGKQVATDLGLTVAAVYHARSRVVTRLRELIQSARESE